MPEIYTRTVRSSSETLSQKEMEDIYKNKNDWLVFMFMHEYFSWATVHKAMCNHHVRTVLIFLGRGTGVSAVPAGVPLVSSAAGWDGVPIFAC